MLQSFFKIKSNVLPIWVGVDFEVRPYPPWKTLKRRRDAEYNYYPHAYLYWLLAPGYFSLIFTLNCVGKSQRFSKLPCNIFKLAVLSFSLNS